jgi:adenosylhomocysteine nucleosidase
VGSIKYLEGRIGDSDIIALRTGMGARNAGSKATELIELARPQLMIAMGFCGGLRPGLSAGDVVVASEVHELRDVAQEGPRGPSWRAPPELLAASRRVTLPQADAGDPKRVLTGKLVTVPSVFRKPEEKRALGEALGVDVLDMESSAVVLAAGTREVPALCVRALLDDVDCERPFDFGRILSPSGRLRPTGVLGEVAKRPSGLMKIPDLRTRERAEQASLGAFLAGLLRELDG